jgi:hypothetical protein
MTYDFFWVGVIIPSLCSFIPCIDFLRHFFPTTFSCSTLFSSSSAFETSRGNPHLPHTNPNTMTERQDRDSKRTKKKNAAVRFGDSDFYVQDLGFLEEVERASFQE